jgi:hypothetical protein
MKAIPKVGNCDPDTEIMASIQYRDEIHHSPEDVVFLHEGKWLLGELTIQHDGSVSISGILQDTEMHFKPHELENHNEVKFDKYDKYSVNPYDIGFVPRKMNQVSVESED